jgi:hypothetical protein
MVDVVDSYFSDFWIRDKSMDGVYRQGQEIVLGGKDEDVPGFVDAVIVIVGNRSNPN